MSLADVVWVGVGGGVGAVARFGLDRFIGSRRHSRLPLGTITINVTGSFVLGLLTGLVMFHGAPSSLLIVAGTGFCGGYTTLSTASFETVRLVQKGALGAAWVNASVTLVGALGAGGLGLALARV